MQPESVTIGGENLQTGAVMTITEIIVTALFYHLPFLFGKEEKSI
jgi:hypothetical protein